MVNRGDVCWVELPSEKRRPAVVLTRSQAIPVMRKVTVAFLSGTIRGIPTEVPLGTDDGLPKECVASLDNVRTINRSFLSEPIASLSGPRMHQVCKALAIASGCD
jgi:mRNA interferase MazF